MNRIKGLSSLTLIVSFLFLTILFLRFFRLGENFTFDIDAQYQALLAQTIIKHFHIIWIGVSASTIGYYLGPGLVYLTAFLLWISRGDPVSLAVFSSLVGVATAISIFIITDSLYNRSTAFIATLIYGFSTFIISFDHRYWPIFIPLIAVWIFYSLIKAQENTRWLIVSIILISFGYHIHLTLLLFWPFILWEFLSLRKKVKPLTWIAMAIDYFLITFPLLVFDLVHNFDNMLMPLRFIVGFLHKSKTVSPFQFSILLNSIAKIWFINEQGYPIIFFGLTLSLFTFFVYWLLRKKKFQTKLLLTIIILYMILFGLYPGPVQEYYIVFLFPFLAILTALTLDKLARPIAIFIVLLFLIVNFTTTLINRNSRGLLTKKNLIMETTKRLKKDYYLSFDGDLDIEGWRYLFEAYGLIKPAQSKADSMFGWIYPREIATQKPPLKVYVSNDFKVVISPF